MKPTNLTIDLSVSKTGAGRHASLGQAHTKLLLEKGVASREEIGIQHQKGYNSNVSSSEAWKSYRRRGRKQIIWISICRLAEPIAAMSIAPYIYHYIRHLNNCHDKDVGYHVGLLSAAFAAAQFSTGFIWGTLSDKLGKKNCVLLGLLGSASSHLLWGVSSNLHMAFIARLMGGSLNANVSIYKSMIGELVQEDQGMGFASLAAVWAIGSMIGSFIGGKLAFAGTHDKTSFLSERLWWKFPALLSSLVVAGCLLLSFFVAAFFLEDTISPPNHEEGLEEEKGEIFDDDAVELTPAMLDLEPNLRTPLISAVPRSPWVISLKAPKTSTIIASAPRASTPSQSDITLFRTFISPSMLLPWVTSYILITLQTSSYTDLITLFSSTPFTLGGLGFSQTTLSSLFATASLVSAVIQFSALALMRNKTTRGCWFIYVAVAAILPAVSFLTPAIRGFFTTSAANNGNDMREVLILGVVMICQSCSEALGFSVLGCLITSSTPKQFLGRVNGALHSFGALARVIGPLCLTWMFAREASGISPADDKKAPILAWVVLGGIGVFGLFVILISGRRMREDGDGYEAVDG